MADVMDNLAQFTGIAREEMVKLADKVRANHAALSGCLLHDFEEGPRSGGIEAALMPRYKCKRCGGEVDGHAHHWYKIGREQARNV